MLCGKYRSRYQYGESGDCVVLMIIGMRVFWSSFLIAAAEPTIGVLLRDGFALTSLAFLTALFVT